MPDRYLALPPEQGGTSFGPFSAGTICVGTDNRTCQIVLQPGAGLRPLHAQVTFMPDGRALVQAGDRQAALWVHAGGQATPLDGSAILRVGEGFSLASPAGARLVLAELPPVVPVVSNLPPPPKAGVTGVVSHARRDEAWRARQQGSMEKLTAGQAGGRAGPEDRNLRIVLIALGVMAIFAGTCAGLVAAAFAWFNAMSPGGWMG